MCDQCKVKILDNIESTSMPVLFEYLEETNLQEENVL